jgi:hypothetical protein
VRHSINVYQVGRESIGNHCGVDIEGQEPVERARVCIYRYDEIPAASATEIVSLKKLGSGLLTLAGSAQERPGEQADDQSANSRELGAHAAEFQGNFLLCQVNRAWFSIGLGASLKLSLFTTRRFNIRYLLGVSEAAVSVFGEHSQGVSRLDSLTQGRV